MSSIINNKYIKIILIEINNIATYGNY